VTSPDFPFTTDGCSGGMTWLWERLFGPDPPWEGACEAHDRRYWAGGTVHDRRWADSILLCDVTMNGHPIWAFLMWCAVRPGGVPWLPTPWRWGYGYRFPHDYEKDPT